MNIASYLMLGFTTELIRIPNSTTAALEYRFEDDNFQFVPVTGSLKITTCATVANRHAMIKFSDADGFLLYQYNLNHDIVANKTHYANFSLGVDNNIKELISNIEISNIPIPEILLTERCYINFLLGNWQNGDTLKDFVITGFKRLF